MDHLEFPSQAGWEERRQWFQEVLNHDRRGGGYVLGEHALGLLVDLQVVFCAGAYISTIIMACTIVDAHLREVELTDDFSGGMQAAFGSSAIEDLEWLRKLRNALVHFEHRRAGVLTLESHWTERELHQESARKAITLVADVLYEHPFV